MIRDKVNIILDSLDNRGSDRERDVGEQRARNSRASTQPESIAPPIEGTSSIMRIMYMRIHVHRELLNKTK